jgi:RNA polymerase sigma factor (sigma-70 family)
LIPAVEEQALARDKFHPASQRSPWDFTAIVNEHWTGVYKLLHTLTGNLHDTEDLAQETFLKAMNRLDTFQADTNMRAWLLRIATNAFFDLKRKQRRTDSQPLPEEIPEPLQHPGQSLEVKEQHQLLQIAMQELPETARLVFHLRAQEDLSFREIAEMLGTSEEAARWHMHQARSKLLGRLAEQ